MAAYSSIPAWRIPWLEEPGGLQPMGSQRVRHHLATEHTCAGIAKGSEHRGSLSGTVVKTPCSQGREPGFIPGQGSCACVLSRFSCFRLFVTLWTVVCLTPLSMRFSRQEYWSRLPCPPPGGLPDPGVESMTLRSTCIGRGSLALAPPGKPRSCAPQLKLSAAK